MVRTQEIIQLRNAGIQSSRPEEKKTEKEAKKTDKEEVIKPRRKKSGKS